MCPLIEFFSWSSEALAAIFSISICRGVGGGAGWEIGDVIAGVVLVEVEPVGAAVVEEVDVGGVGDGFVGVWNIVYGLGRVVP